MTSAVQRQKLIFSGLNYAQLSRLLSFNLDFHPRHSSPSKRIKKIGQWVHYYHCTLMHIGSYWRIIRYFILPQPAPKYTHQVTFKCPTMYAIILSLHSPWQQKEMVCEFWHPAVTKRSELRHENQRFFSHSYPHSSSRPALTWVISVGLGWEQGYKKSLLQIPV